MRTGTLFLSSPGSFTVTVGAGGAAVGVDGRAGGSGIVVLRYPLSIYPV